MANWHRRHTRKHLRRDGYHVYKKQSELPRFIFYSILSAVIFIAVYSLWLDPSSATNFFDEGKEIISSGLAKIPTNFSSGSTLGINRGIRCEESLQEGIKRHKLKNFGGNKVKIIERESFEDLHKSIDYVKSWDVFNSDEVVSYLQSDYNVHFGDIQLALVRFEGETCFLDTCAKEVSLQFAVCEDVGKENQAFWPTPSLFGLF